MKNFAVLVSLAVLISALHCASENINATTDYVTTDEPTSTVTPTPTPTPEEFCAQHNSSCNDCVKSSAKCYYCYKNERCSYYPYSHLAPRYDECGTLGDMAWGTCLINFEVLIISLGVIGGVIFLAIIICCCCCCKKRRKKRMEKDEVKWSRQREERKMRAEERKKERQSKTDEIRRKYGLLVDSAGLLKDDNPYKRFDA